MMEIVVKQNKIEGNYSESILKAINIVESFFETKLNFKIVFLETREEMNNVYSKMLKSNQKTEDWVIGGFFGGDSVYIFSEDSYSKVSCHKQETFLPSLIHEITHLFSNKILKFHLPMWFNEGLSYFVSNQDKDKVLENKENLIEAHYQGEWMKMNPYLTAGKFVRFLIDNYGKNKIFLFLKNIGLYSKKDTFEIKFRNFFGKSFEQIFEEWNPINYPQN